MTRIILIASLFITACNSPAKTDTVSENAITDTSITDDTYIATTPIPIAGCYAWAVNKDTATMKLEASGSMVKGSLLYDWSEKDRNSGMINGVIKDSLILANYTFEAEGMTSVREVVFKISGASLLEGFGDVNAEGDTVKFKNRAELQFMNDRPFEKIECK
ncbi:MAG: hypothetical protein JWQ40_114 [Segetibacter sp.]|nr:hypothetical protein [Segetibacter sp.]